MKKKNSKPPKNYEQYIIVHVNFLFTCFIVAFYCLIDVKIMNIYLYSNFRKSTIFLNNLHDWCNMQVELLNSEKQTV